MKTLRIITTALFFISVIGCAGAWEGRRLVDNFDNGQIGISVKKIEAAQPGFSDWLRVVVLNKTDHDLRAMYVVTLKDGNVIKDQGTITIPSANTETILVAVGISKIDAGGQVKVITELGVTSVTW